MEVAYIHAAGRFPTKTTKPLWKSIRCMEWILQEVSGNKWVDTSTCVRIIDYGLVTRGASPRRKDVPQLVSIAAPGVTWAEVWDAYVVLHSLELARFTKGFTNNFTELRDWPTT